MAAAAAVALPASAATVGSWSTTATFGLTSNKTFDGLVVRAYSTSQTAGQGVRGQTDGSSWLAAQIAGYGSSGFGVKNACSTSPNGCTARDRNEGNDPEHSVDNEQLVDIVVFELPKYAGKTWSFSSLSIGYTSNDSSPEVNIWVGGSSLGQNYDFSTACFLACTTLGDKSLSDLGFSYAGRVDFNTNGNGQSNADINAADTGSALFAGQDKNATGQYIVVAASSTAGGLWDAFKINGLKATKSDQPDTPPPGTSVPVPGSLALLAGGLLGFACMRRRPG